MFTVEMELDEVAITILDDSGKYEDLQIFVYDDVVYFKQWNNKSKSYTVITITPQVFEELIKSLNKPIGAYIYRTAPNTNTTSKD